MKSIAKLFALADRFEKKADTAQSVKLYWMESTPASADDIIKAQRALKAKGYNLGTTGPTKDGVDGVWGNLSRNALEDFQRKNQLLDTGNLDNNTADKLGLVSGAA